MLKDKLKEASYRLLEIPMGRRNVARLGRFLSNRARLDVPNDMRSNGELLVIDAQLAVRGTDGFVAFDVGANVGDWTRALLERLRGDEAAVRIYAFEPVASTRRTLEASLSQLTGCSRVTVVAAALSNVAGVRSMFIVGDGAGTNSLHADGGGAGRTEEITTETLDEFCTRESIDHIDVMKVDTEGHDLAVLEGARGMLGRNAIDAVQFEYNHRWVFGRHFLFDAFGLLSALGYRVGKVTPLGIEFYDAWHPELETFREGNYLACPISKAGRFRRIRWWNE